MTRVDLKGLHRVKKRLATGEVRTYYYAWRGGPKIEAEPGTPEFLKEFAAAGKTPPRHAGGTLQTLLDKYQKSSDFTEKAATTRRDYARHIMEIERAFGDFPLVALTDPATRGVMLDWRDQLLPRGKRYADYVFAVFGRVLSWAKARGLTTVNPLEKAGRLYKADRTENIWTDADEARFLDLAPAHLHLPLIMALWTGQRQGDLLRLTWRAYDGKTIRLRQQKTGARLVIPVAAPLKERLDAMPRLQPQILLSTDNRPWTSDGFRSSWGKACEKAGIKDLTFHDLRGTAVTRLAIAGATEAEIATFTGHSLVTVRQILDAHYLSRDPQMALNAIAKLVERRKNDNL